MIHFTFSSMACRFQITAGNSHFILANSVCGRLWKASDAKVEGQFILNRFVVMALSFNHKCGWISGVFLEVKYGGLKFWKIQTAVRKALYLFRSNIWEPSAICMAFNV